MDLFWGLVLATLCGSDRLCGRVRVRTHCSRDFICFMPPSRNNKGGLWDHGLLLNLCSTFCLVYVARTSVSSKIFNMEGSNLACRLLFMSIKINVSNLGSRNNFFGTHFFLIWKLSIFFFTYLEKVKKFHISILNCLRAPGDIKKGLTSEQALCRS